MRHFIIFRVLSAALILIAGCAQELELPPAYTVKYSVPEYRQSPELLGILYYQKQPLQDRVGFVSISPNGQRVIFSRGEKLYYSQRARIEPVELPAFALPTSVVWKKYEAEIFFAERQPHSFQLF